MIKASELRIGNWVYNEYTRKPQETYPMMIAQIATIEKEGGQVNMSGILLTEEWLIKFGVTIENTVGGYLKWEIKNSKGRIIKLLDRKFTWGAGEYSDYILYVHQLQNLYFALTQEELTIK